MASEFYHKTLALYEDFRQRELHYLKYERSYNRDRGFQNNERNLPLEQYLQKISAREQETEKSYGVMMKKLDELDQQTETMKIKIEKLQLLKKSLSAVNFQVLPSQHSSETASNLKFFFASNEDTSAVINNNEIGEVFNPKCTTLHSHSTQTDVLICPNCKGGIFLQKFGQNENRIPAETPKKSIFTLPTIENSVKKIRNSVELKEMQHDLISSEQNVIMINSNEVLDQNNELATLKDNALIEDTNYPSSISNDASYEHRNASTDASRNKSDDESMNREFDFLESDSKSLPKKIYSVGFQTGGQPISSNDQIVRTTNSVNEVATALPKAEQSSNSVAAILVPPRRKNSSYKGDSSFTEKNQLAKSVAAMNKAPQEGKASKSMNINKGKEKVESSAKSSVEFEKKSSVTDTEESSSEKSVPLTSTAAYQVLLGKATATQRTVHQKSISETDSEDEVENALSKAIKKKEIKLVENNEDQKIEEKKKIVLRADTVDLKDSSRRPSKVIANKPQSKLSKNTRKVLGFESSSGSEMEPEIKPKEQIKEDSDEFDFYD